MMNEVTLDKKSMSHIFKEYRTLVIAYSGLLFCILVFTIFPPLYGESIWTVAKLSTLMADVIVLAILAVGASFIYSMGDMDISIGRQVGLYATLIVIIGNTTGNLVLGILLSLAISLIIAVINGSTGELLKIHPIIPSLVFFMALGGVSTLVYSNLGSRNITLKGIDYSFFKSPILMLVVLVIEIIIVSYLFNYTKIGKNTKAIGANRVAAEQSGINIMKYKIISYLISAVCIVIASIFQMGFTGSASESTGVGFEMNVIVALILGGMPLAGGMKARISCAVIGTLTLSLLNIGLPLLRVEPNQVFIIKALIFLVVVLLTSRKASGILPR